MASASKEEVWETAVKPFPQEIKFVTEGAEFIGIYDRTEVVDLEQVDDNGGQVVMRPTNLHVLTVDGEEFSIWGGKNLDLAFSRIPVGSITKVIYVRKVALKGGHSVKAYDVTFKR